MNNEVYKTKADLILDQLQQGFKIDQKEFMEEIPEEVWVLEINNTKGSLYLWGDPKNYIDGENFAVSARAHALDLVNNR